jgi:hypothetical protein
VREKITPTRIELPRQSVKSLNNEKTLKQGDKTPKPNDLNRGREIPIAEYKGSN